ncbi:MAG: hypothetical protein LV480_01060 [Methylacidiphilales bacterium]|nr:hypothetical protein [Candidatus Methylacidiphilales bacterium]
MRPDPAPRSALGGAVRKGVLAARQNLVPMLALQAAMAVTVAIYYGWPAATAVLSDYAEWQHSGGVFAAALATALAGGVLSELSLVYIQDKGRWSARHLGDMGFKFAFFFINGSVVYEFYCRQAVWFGEGVTWSVLLPKVLVDQFIFTIVWAMPFQSLAFRWQALRFSGKRLWKEMNRAFVTERMLPVLMTNWMFWIPGTVLIYSMPTHLQTPLFVFAIAIWGLLLPAVTRQGANRSADPAPVPPSPAILPQAAE